MGSSPRRLSILAALSILALSACTDPVSAPASRGDAPSLAVSLSGETYVASGKVLHRTDWVNYDVTDSVRVTPDKGGNLDIRSAGISVKIPRGAVSAPTTIWVTAYAGNKVAYEFGPHGTQFLVPIAVTQDLRDTKAYGDKKMSGELFGGYTPEGTNDISSDGTVKVSETLDVDLVPDNHRIARWARYYPTHFSGYVLASGRLAY